MAASRDVERVKPGFKIDEEIPLHIKGWKIQRVLWVLLFLVIILSLAGLFGDGYASSRKETKQNITTEFEHFLRREAESILKFSVSGNQPATIRIPQEYLDQVKITSIIPAPQQTFFSGQDVVYSFFSDANATISFYYEAQKTGTVSTRVIVNNVPFTIKHFIYP